MINSDVAIFTLTILDDETYILGYIVAIDSGNHVIFYQNDYATLPPTSDSDQDKFLKGDGTWSELPLTPKTIVNISNTSSGITSDMTYDEIMDAYNSGDEIIANVSIFAGGGFIAELLNTAGYIRFISAQGHSVTITSDNSISIDWATYIKYTDIQSNFLECGRTDEYTPGTDYSPATKKYVDDSVPEKLPNPQKLTFAGAVTAEYDGSGAVTVTIPTAEGSLTERIEKTDSDVTLEPNKLYIFPEMETLSISLAEITDASVVNEYHFVFQSGATATTFSIPDTVKIPSVFAVEANKIYEVSIMENCLTYQSWAVA